MDTPAAMPFTVAIMVFTDVEELDFVGPFEVFKTVAAIVQDSPEERPWQVITVAQQEGLISTSGGLRIQPDYTFANHPSIDLLLIPGGDTSQITADPAVLAWVKQVAAHAQLNTSVCTGAFLLGSVGLLDGRKSTTHWASLDRLAERFPQTQVQREVRWVDEGTVITAAGVSAGLDMSLHVVERLLGRKMAESVARYMEYTWDDRGR
jgi:transcriptional regulator GlxA family with amidase domain